jgi:hypothetical protein
MLGPKDLWREMVQRAWSRCLVILWILLLSQDVLGRLNSSMLGYDLQESRQSNHKLVECTNTAKITFIMPSSGSRSSIKTAIRSLQLLNSCEWKLIVVYSTLEALDDQLEIYPPLQMSRFSQGFEDDPRVFYLPAQRPSLFNYGGISRNAAMRHATTEWIAFLDDDDELSSDYLTFLEQESQAHPSISVILFRMSCNTCYAEIIPPVPYPALLPGYVGQFHHPWPTALSPLLSGISYALRRSLVSPMGRHEFRNGPQEDYRLLHDLHACSLDILVSGSVAYFVRGWRAKNYRPAPSTIIPGADSCNHLEIVEKYPPPFDIRFKLPAQFRSLHNGLQEALVRASRTSCVDPIFFRKRFKVSLSLCLSLCLCLSVSLSLTHTL